MDINLYPCFKHWLSTEGNKNNAIWFYSDPHFADAEMPYIRKNYIGDEEQVKRINNKVGKNDTIIFLGDIGDISFIQKIRGYKVLIKGNHDSGPSKYQRIEQTISEQEVIEKNLDITLYKKMFHPIIGYYYYYDNKLFDEVYEGTLQINPKIILSHEPVEYEYCFNIHGHDHSNWYNKENHLNVCAEHINYTPVSLKSILEKGVLKNIPDIHRVTIDTATNKKYN